LRAASAVKVSLGAAPGDIKRVRVSEARGKRVPHEQDIGVYFL
jgi:hypothetical protein